jgi:hypothetical protein
MRPSVTSPTQSLFALERWRVDAAVAMAEGALNGTEPKRGIWDDRDYLCAILAVLTGDGDRARAAILGAGEDSRSSSSVAPDGPEHRQRVRMDLEDGAYMHVCVSPDASPETLAALRSVGEAAARRMRDEAWSCSCPPTVCNELPGCPAYARIHGGDRG